MAITQPSLIGWQAVESSSDLQRIQSVLDNLGDEDLMLLLEQERAGRRNRYPIRVLWNTLFAGLLLGHPTYESLRRELCRNAELRQMLGYDPMLGSEAVAPGYVISRFHKLLEKHLPLVEAIFTNLVGRLFEQLPAFGTNLAHDGKAIKSLMTADRDASCGKKTTTDEGATLIATWFGFKIHCLSDVQTELPIAFFVTNASAAESPLLQPLLEDAIAKHPSLAQRAKTLAADRGLDDGADKLALHQKHGIAPIIPARDLAKKVNKPLLAAADTIYQSPTAEILCLHDPANPDPAKRFAAMQYNGFEKDRQANRFHCPAATLGLTCKNQHNCQSRTKDQGTGRVVRVPLENDPRLSLPIHQHSRRFKDLYKGRTSIERLFYRLDHLFGMETPLRSTGLTKAKIRITLAMSAMVATGLAWLSEERADMIRSRLQTSAA
jgi:hypothetical protein